jgi:hypothetical protein
MASNLAKYDGDIARDTTRVVMIGQFVGRCVSGLFYEEDNILLVFFAFGLFILAFGNISLVFNYCAKAAYVNVVDEELGEDKPNEEKTEEITASRNPKPYINTLLLFTLQPSAATAVFYLLTGPFRVLPSSITSIKTFLSFVRILASFTGSLSHLSANSLSFVLHTPIVFTHVGYMFFVSQNYTVSIDDEIIYLLIGMVSTVGYTVFSLAWNDTMCEVAAAEKGRESIVMAKWTTIFFFVSLIPNIFEFVSITALGIDHGNFDLISNFAISCFVFTCVTWTLHRCLSLCRVIY